MQRLLRFILFLCIWIMTVAGLSSAQQAPGGLLYNLPELTPGAVLSGSLDVDDGQNFKDGARLDQVKLYLQAGDVVELSLSSDSFDTFLSVYDPAGNLIALNDDAEDYLSSATIIDADSSGRYMVIVSGYSDLDLGDYSLSASRLTVQDGGEIKLGQTLPGLLNDKDDQLNYRYLDSFAFTLKKPTTIEINMRSTLLDSYLILLSADGENVINENDDNENGSGYNARLTADLPAGQYVIWATTNGEGTEGFYKLSLEELR